MHECTVSPAMTAYLNVLIRHANVISICFQIFWCGHDGELDSALVGEGLVRPLPYGSDHLHRGDTVVRDEYLTTRSALACGAMRSKKRRLLARGSVPRGLSRTLDMTV